MIKLETIARKAEIANTPVYEEGFNPNEPVRFVVKQLGDAYSIKDKLEGMANDLSIHILDLKNLGIQYLIGTTSQGTYENLFNAELSYSSRTINNINRGPYQVNEWVEMKKAEVPKELQKDISDIYIEQKMYLTD